MPSNNLSKTFKFSSKSPCYHVKYKQLLHMNILWWYCGLHLSHQDVLVQCLYLELIMTRIFSFQPVFCVVEVGEMQLELRFGSVVSVTRLCDICNCNIKRITLQHNHSLLPLFFSFSLIIQLHFFFTFLHLSSLDVGKLKISHSWVTLESDSHFFTSLFRNLRSFM